MPLHVPIGPSKAEFDLSVLDILDDLGVLHFSIHSRYRVYPQDVAQAITLTAAALVNTYGSWIECIPLNTIPFAFHIIGFCICEVSVATNYHIQLGYNTINADPGENMEIGERRVRVAVTPLRKQSELLGIAGLGVPANSRIMGRLKTTTGDADTCSLSVVLMRHLEVAKEVEPYPSFPW